MTEGLADREGYGVQVITFNILNGLALTWMVKFVKPH